MRKLQYLTSIVSQYVTAWLRIYIKKMVFDGGAKTLRLF